MIVNDNYLNVLAEEENINYNKVSKYYDYIKDIPCVSSDETLHSLNCLYILTRLMKSNKHNSIDYVVSDALYKTYDDLSIPYLSDEYYDEKILLKKKI